MNFLITGHCIRCGSPMWSPATWDAQTPPPTHPSCLCNNNSMIIHNSSEMASEKVLSLLKKMEERLSKLENKLNNNESSDKTNKTTFLKD